jgi:hypothetical protein
VEEGRQVGNDDRDGDYARPQSKLPAAGHRA